MNTRRNPILKPQRDLSGLKRNRPKQPRVTTTSVGDAVAALLAEFPDLAKMRASQVVERVRTPNYAAARRALADGTLTEAQRADIEKSGLNRFPEIRALLKGQAT